MAPGQTHDQTHRKTAFPASSDVKPEPCVDIVYRMMARNSATLSRLIACITDLAESRIG